MPALPKPQRTINPKREGLYFSAFGESLIEKNTNYGQFSTPYRFNGKELDPETENYYYGARYYNPVWGIWLGVDPLAGDFPSLTPYNFVENNPIMLLDPDGNGPTGPEGLGSNPLFTVVHGFQIYFQGVGRQVDDLGAKVKGWVSMNFNSEDGTATATRKVTVEAGTSAEEFFTPTNNKPSTRMPMELKIKEESYIEITAGATTRTPYGPVSAEISQNVDSEGNSSTTATVSYGGQGQGIYGETSINNRTGESTSRAGVRAKVETPKVSGWTIGMGAELSIGQN